ncbi:MAG: hypothetical protein AAGA75_21425 [Cyanobacteria bacterium P01_E01_bin.6]
MEDYDQGLREGRYCVGELPHLSFADSQFDLALCSHFLFLYSAHLDYAFHRNAVFELLRVSREVRIFPLTTLMLERSLYIDDLRVELEQRNYVVSIVKSNYEFQKGGHEMMVIQPCNPPC